MNYTWPGRFHLIWRRGSYLWITLWFWGRRYHCNPALDSGPQLSAYTRLMTRALRITGIKRSRD